MDRNAIHDEFVKRYHFGEEPQACLADRIDWAETELGLVFPRSYQRHGEVYTPDLLNRIVELGLQHPDLHDICSPEEAVENTKAYWSGGMPEDIAGFGGDCMGNMFGFGRSECKQRTLDDSTVWFFDHDFVEVYAIADSFDALLLWYLEHL